LQRSKRNSASPTGSRNPLLVTHSVADILRARMLAIACGYEDADDLDHLRTTLASNWPADGCQTAAPIFARSQPCRAGRNAPTLREVAGHTRDEKVMLSDGAVATEPLLRKVDGRPFMAGPLIAGALKRIAGALRKSNYLRGLPREEFASRAADVMIDINGIHPFREGNGRTHRVFMRELASEAGHKLNFSVVTRERMIQASIAANERGDSTMMRRMFGEISDTVRVAAWEKAIGALNENRLRARTATAIIIGRHPICRSRAPRGATPLLSSRLRGSRSGSEAAATVTPLRPGDGRIRGPLRQNDVGRTLDLTRSADGTKNGGACGSAEV
jgi:fido (protein-threonine AMPylation protein)